MTNLKIVLPSTTYEKELSKIAVEFINTPSPFDIMHRNNIVTAYETNNFESYFTKVENNRNGITNEGRVPSSLLWIMDEEKIVAIADIRHFLNDYLRNVQGGHIAYEIVPSFRGKGLMNKIGKMLLSYAKENFGIQEALITCREKNIPSHKVIVRLMNEMGGHPDTDTLIDEEVEKRYWIKTTPPQE